jgi:hypothetical protein
MRVSFKRAFAVPLLALGVTAIASAGPIANATFSFNKTGSVSYTGTNLGTSTSITLPATLNVDDVPLTYLGSPNDFLGESVLGSVMISPLAITGYTVGVTSPFVQLAFLSFASGTMPSDRFTFDAQTVRGISGNADLQLQLIFTGLFNDSLGEYTSGELASVSLIFTSDSPTSAIGFAGTFSTPPQPSDVPEPATMALLGGALLVVGVGRRFSKV